MSTMAIENEPFVAWNSANRLVVSSSKTRRLANPVKRIGASFGGVVCHLVGQFIELGLGVRELPLHFLIGLYQSSHEGRNGRSRVCRFGRQLPINLAHPRVVLSDVGRHAHRQAVQARQQFLCQSRVVGSHNHELFGPAGIEPPTGTQATHGKHETE